MKYPFLKDPLKPVKEIGSEPFSSIIFKNTIDDKSVLVEIDLNLLSDELGVTDVVYLKWIAESAMRSLYRAQEWNHTTKAG